MSRVLSHSKAAFDGERQRVCRLFPRGNGAGGRELWFLSIRIEATHVCHCKAAYQTKRRGRRNSLGVSMYKSHSEVIRAAWVEGGFPIDPARLSGLNHPCTDLTRALICNHSHGNNSDYAVQGGRSDNRQIVLVIKSAPAGANGRTHSRSAEQTKKNSLTRDQKRRRARILKQGGRRREGPRAPFNKVYQYFISLFSAF